VIEFQGETFVYVRDRDGLFERRRVEVAASNNEKVQVKSGLSPGEMVVTSGLYQLRNYRKP